jgi:predicted SAM-dependent methyltransferase
LNFGCGKDIRPEYLNVDIIKMPGVDKVVDFNKFPYPFKDNTFEEVIIVHVLEHLDNFIKVMQDLHRVCRGGAIIKIWGPYFHHHTAYQDPTHKHFFTLGTFDYFSSNYNLNYYTKARFKILKKKLIPSWLGQFVPLKRYFLNMLGMIFGELVEQVYFELKVIK